MARWRCVIISTISRIKRFLRLASDPRRQDLVVGDLHGDRQLPKRELDRLGFNSARDRVLSAGDLIDRGSESIATLALLGEPWFHAVLGNHELMLLNHLGEYNNRIHSRKSILTGGGERISDAMDKHCKAVEILADQLAALPPSIRVAVAASLR